MLNSGSAEPKVKLLFFTSTKAVHSQKWLRSLAHIFDVHVACFSVEPEDRLEDVTYHEIKPKVATNSETSRTTGEPSVRQEARLTFTNGIKYARAFANVIDQVQPALLHAHQSVPFGWYALRARARAKRRVSLIVSVWGTDVMAYPEQSFLFKLMNRSVLKRATAMTATSKALVSAASRWVTRNDWLVIPFGVDTSLFTKKPVLHEPARVFGMSKSLRFIGELDVYGFTTALRAMSIALRQHPNWVLEISGGGPKESHLKKLAASLGISSSVRFLGQQTQRRVAEIMRGWDALLLPSKQESFGVAAVEAAAVGIPVIAADVGGVSEIVRPGETGILLKAGTALTAERLAQAMEELDSKLVHSAYERGPKLVADTFSWKKSVARMRQLYEALA